MEENKYWEAICRRNQEYDGVFVYAVRSTGIYCRPSCPSRHLNVNMCSSLAGLPGPSRPGTRGAAGVVNRTSERPDEPNLALVQRMCRYLSERARASSRPWRSWRRSST